MSATISVTESMLYAALRAWLLAILPVGTSVMQGQQNRVAMPLDPLVIMTALSTPVLSTNRTAWAPGSANPGSEANGRSIEWVCQLDVYGDNAADAAGIVALLGRSAAAYDFFSNLGDVLRPLYATEPRQTSMINSEDQYEQRYTLEFHAQYNPVVSTNLDFAIVLKIGLAEVDVTYPP